MTSGRAIGSHLAMQTPVGRLDAISASKVVPATSSSIFCRSALLVSWNMRRVFVFPTAAGVSLLPVGTYDTDYLLVRETQLDVALACSGGDQVSILFGRGNGKFDEGPQYPVHRTPVSISSQDVNGDGHPDLAVALRNDKVKIFLGSANGEFRPGVQYEYGDTPTSVALKDLNQDGKPDLVVTNGGPMLSAVSVWIGNGDGTFLNPKDYKTGRRPLGVSFADFNSDHLPDLLVINGEGDSFTTFLGNGNGTFQPGKDSGADASPNFGVAHDFDGDHIDDVAVVNLQSTDLSILFGRGDGTFHYPPRNYRTKNGPFAVASYRVSADNEEEPGLVTADNGAASVSVFLHHGRKGQLPPTTKTE